MTIDDLEKKVTNQLQELIIKQEKRNNIQKQIEKEKIEFEKTLTKRKLTEKARNLCFEYLEQGKLRSKTIVEEIGTIGLKSTFGEGYEVRIDYSEKRNSSHAEIRVTNPMFVDLPGIDSTTKLEHRGGGLIDVVSMCLAISMIEITSPRIEGPLMADETFKHLDKNRLPGCSDVLRATLNPDGKGAEGDGRQLIFTTHSDELINNVDKVFQLKIRNDKTTIEELDQTMTEIVNETND